MTEHREFTARRLVSISAALGIVGFGLWGAGAAMDPTQALHSYLVAFAYVTSLALGALLLLMIGHAVSARWMVVVRRLQEAMVSALPMLALLFIPVALGLGYLYVWADLPAHIDPAHVDEELAHRLEHKRPYLNVPFFIGRTAFYFAVWILVAELLRRWSLARDRRAREPAGEHEGETRRETRLAAAMLPLVGLCLTFAAFDWLMSLDPTWFSSMYGVYYFAGSFMGGLALLAVLSHATKRSGLLARELSRFHFHAVGRLLLAFVLFWAYIAFFQAMLIQIANRPEEVTFYLRRTEGTWLWFCYALIIGHFVAPFVLLLPRDVKYRPAALATIAGWLLVMHYIDIYWLILPFLHDTGAAPHWLDLAALMGVSGLACAFAAWRQRGVPVLPRNDPRLARALTYRSGE